MQKKKVLAAVKGFRGRARHCIRIARNRYEKSLLHAYVGRKQKARDLRSMWIQRINAGCRLYDLQYGRFIHGLKKLDVDLNRKMLSELAVYEPYTFRSLVQQVKGMTAVPTISHMPSLGHLQSTLVVNQRVKQWSTSRAAQTTATRKFLTEYYERQRAEQQAVRVGDLAATMADRKPTVTVL